MLNQIKQSLRKVAEPDRVPILSSFFKTGKGQYGEGDKFLGITVPNTRKVAKQYQDADFTTIQKLLYSKIHEERLCALLILVHQFQKGNKQEQIVDFYLKHAKQVNNWDLVDLTSEKILGAWLFNKNKDVLYKLMKSNNLWEQRISIIATFYFIKNNKFDDTLKIATHFLTHKHDLMHKAVGWMLREVGKRNQATEEQFLKKYYKTMPRTMLRYAIERFDEKKRRFYMGK